MRVGAFCMNFKVVTFVTLKCGNIIKYLAVYAKEVFRMPRKPLKPCKHPGCPKLTVGNYCEEHEPFRCKERGSAYERGYDSRWRKARVRFLKANPLCVKCNGEGKVVAATVVDHVIPHRGDHVLFWDESNWQALCKGCHDTKTMTEDRYQEYEY